WNNYDPPNPLFPSEGVSLDVSQPDGGVAGNRAADVAYFPSGGGGIADAAPGQNGSPDIPSINKFTTTLNMDAVDPNGFFGSVADLEVDVSVIHPHDNHVRMTLTGPAPGGGLATVTLLFNHLNPDGTVNPL